MITGVSEVVLKLKAFVPKVTESIMREIDRQSYALQRHIVENKLSGQVLKRRTGALSNSIRVTPAKMVDGVVMGQVGSALTVPRLNGTRISLLAVQQFGAIITAKRVMYLRFLIGDHWVRTRRVELPPRPVLGPALDDRREQIVEGLTHAVAEAMQ